MNFHGDLLTLLYYWYGLDTIQQPGYDFDRRFTLQPNLLFHKGPYIHCKFAPYEADGDQPSLGITYPFRVCMTGFYSTSVP
jgi:hypothetical protein